MSHSNSYSPSKQQEVPHTTELPYPYERGVTIYIGLCLFLWFFVAPLIAPTDVPPEGMPSIPPYLLALQFLVGYGVPAIVVQADWRRHHRSQSLCNPTTGGRPSDDELKGMTVIEQLCACGLLDAWNEAAMNRERTQMIALLLQTSIQDDQAERTTDAVLENPEIHGY